MKSKLLTFATILTVFSCEPNEKGEKEETKYANTVFSCEPNEKGKKEETKYANNPAEPIFFVDLPIKDEVQFLNGVFERYGKDCINKKINIEGHTFFQDIVQMCISSKLVESLIDNGGDVNVVDNAQNTLLHLVSCSEVAQLLLKKIDIDKKNKYGYTPLLFQIRKAEFFRHVGLWEDDYAKQLIKLFIDNNADVNLAGDDGLTPLYLASFYGDVEIVEMLIAKGAKVDAKYNNKTALDIATENSNLKNLNEDLKKEYDAIVALLTKKKVSE